MDELYSCLHRPVPSAAGVPVVDLDSQLQVCLDLVSDGSLALDSTELAQLLRQIRARLRQDRIEQESRRQSLQYTLLQEDLQRQDRPENRLSGDAQAMAMLLSDTMKGWKFKLQREAFDRAFYLESNPDVAMAGADPRRHFIASGAAEGRAPVDLVGRYPQCYSDEHLPAANLSALLERRKPVHCRTILQGIRNAALSSAGEQNLAVSVIMPTWNRAHSIRRAVASALLQSIPPRQVIVIDDGSTDGTADLLRYHFTQPIETGQLLLLEGGHEGVSAARNTGLAAASGDAIAYLDSDNEWMQDHLLYALCGLAAGDGYDIAYTAMHRHELDGGWSDTVFEPFDPVRLRQQNYIDLNCLIHRRALYDQLGGFDTGLTRLVDWELILKFCADRPARGVPVATVDYFVSGEGLGNISKTEDLAPNLARIAARHNLDISGK